MKNLIFVLALITCASNARAAWELLPAVQVMENVSALESDGRRLYAGTRRGLYISDDNGDTWRTTALAQSVRTIAISDDAVYVFVYEHGVFRSDDNGETWNPINNGLHTIDDRTGEMRLPSIHQMLVTGSGMVIAVGYHFGTYISRDRGETWHYPFEEWVFEGPYLSTYIAWDTWSMIEFNGFLWSAGISRLHRTADEGETWERLPNWAAARRALSDYGEVRDWAVFDDRLYVAATNGFARWDEGELAWDDLSRGLPDKPQIEVLALNRGRIFAGLQNGGVWMFDEPSEAWIPAGLQELRISVLVSHQSRLYAVALYDNWNFAGVFRASIPLVHPYGKAAATWGAVKTK